MRKILLLVFPLLLLNFNQSKAETVYTSIPFLRGADLCNLQDTYSQSRRQFINEKIQQAALLFSVGAIGEEVAALFAQFDSMYDYHREEAVKYLDVSVEGLVKSYLQSYYSYYKPLSTNLEFSNFPQDSDFLPVGSFTISSRCNGDIILNLSLINTKTGKILSFTAEGRADFATHSIAQQLFDKFQKTKFPSTIKRIDGSSLVLLGTPTGRLTDRVNWETGSKACRAMKGRLPTESELREIDMYGDYSGGITLKNVDSDYSELMFLLNSKDTVFYNRFEQQAVQNFKNLNSKTAFFFCVK